jgi:hypothetical protein
MEDVTEPDIIHVSARDEINLCVPRAQELNVPAQEVKLPCLNLQPVPSADPEKVLRMVHWAIVSRETSA